MTRQGEKASEVFKGKGQSTAVKLFYAESADLFADTIRKNLKPSKYSLADLGGHKGEFLSELLIKLPEYEFDSVIIDREEGLVDDVSAKKILGDIKNLPFADKSIDVVIMRYVLAWNLPNDQRIILREISRICKGIAVIQHQGADSDDPVPLQEASGKIFGGFIKGIKKRLGFYTESERLEIWMDEFDIPYEKIQERRIENVSDTYIERFKLSEEERLMLKDVFKGCDYCNQSTYLLKFK